MTTNKKAIEEGIVEITEEKVHIKGDPAIEVIVRIVPDETKILTKTDMEKDKSILLYSSIKGFAINRGTKDIDYGERQLIVSHETLPLLYILMNSLIGQWIEDYMNEVIGDMTENTKTNTPDTSVITNENKTVSTNSSNDYKEKYSGKLVVKLLDNNNKPIGNLTLEGFKFIEDNKDPDKIAIDFKRFIANTHMTDLSNEEFLDDIIAIMAISSIRINDMLEDENSTIEYPEAPPDTMYA